MTWADYLKSRRTLTASEVKEAEAKHDKAQGLIVPATGHPEYGAAAH